MIYTGFDTYEFPGVDKMAWLKKNTNLAITGFYLAPAPSHPDDGWMPHYLELKNQGWGFLPIFLGQEMKSGPGSHILTAAQGKIDGELAVSLMAKAGFSPHSTCFLDLEDGAPFVEPRKSYVIAWAQAYQKSIASSSGTIGGHVGIYCSYQMANDVHTALLQAGIESPQMWVYKVSTLAKHKVASPFAAPAPSGSGYIPAYFWQHDQNALININGHTTLVDLSSSLFADPSAP